MEEKEWNADYGRLPHIISNKRNTFKTQPVYYTMKENKIKRDLKQAIKDVLVDLAMADKLPLDLNELDTSKFDKALKPIDELVEALSEMVTNADEDCPAEYRTKHFRTAMKNAFALLK